MHAAHSKLGFDIDYKRLRDYFTKTGTLIRAYYYTALLDNDQFTKFRPITDWLQYNGYKLITKPVKEYHNPQTGERNRKGNMDIEIAVDAMELAPRLDHVVLFSGDGDFRRLVESLQRQGVRVTIVSTIQSRPSICSDDLRRQADVYIDLEDIKYHIMREQR